MAANLGILALLTGCDEPESPNPFDDWGPYKACEQRLLYTYYDVEDPNAEGYFAGSDISLYTAQGGLLQRDRYSSDHTLTYTELCSYDERTHAPAGCDVLVMAYKKPYLYSTRTYGYRADGLLAWEWYLFPDDDVTYVYTWTRDEADRIVRVDGDAARTDGKGDGDVAGVPYVWDVWIYDANGELTIYEGDSALPSEIDSYEYDHYGRESLTGVTRYTVENHEIVHSEQATPDGDVDEVHDYTYDDDHHLLTDVRDDGVEITTYTYDDRGFVVTGTHQLAWKDLSDVRTDVTAAITYDCEAP